LAIDTAQYDEIVAAINKKYDAILKRGDEMENPERLSTGSLELDMAMGGGVPIGRFTRLAGAFSTGKSLTGWSIIRSAQEMGMKCIYYNVEKQYTPEFTESRGVNIHDLDIVNATTVESIAEICESLLPVAHVHVIDSTKAAVSEEVLAANIRDWRPGIEARAWGKAFAFLNDRFDMGENVIVLIDQVRIKKFGPDAGEEPAGGKVMDHASSMTVVFRKGSWLKYNSDGLLTDDKKVPFKKSSDGQMIPDGRIIQARVEKSRVSRPLLPATMWLDLNTNDFDRTFEMKKHGITCGVIEQGGGGNYKVNYENGKQEKVRGEKDLRALIREDIDLQELIWDKSLDLIGRL